MRAYRGVERDAARVVPAAGGAAADGRAAGRGGRGPRAGVARAAGRRGRAGRPRHAAAPAPHRARPTLHPRHDTPHHAGHFIQHSY